MNQRDARKEALRIAALLCMSEAAMPTDLSAEALDEGLDPCVVLNTDHPDRKRLDRALNELSDQLMARYDRMCNNGARVD